MHKILIVDDEVEIANIIAEFLSINGFLSKSAYNGLEALELFDSFEPDLILLDVMLPEIDGIEVCKRIRERSTVPIIMVSAKRSDTDKILGLGLGADDYVSKPFSMTELVARVSAQLRRNTEYSINVQNIEKSIIDDIEIDWKLYKATRNEEEINLSVKELEILKFMMDNKHQVLTKEQIYSHVWGYKVCYELNTVVVHINKIREKIEKDPKNPKFIKTVWGVGYKFEMK